MPRSNKTKYAILGFLSYQPMSGYDLKKKIENSVSYFWSESYGQIYPILKKMKEEGLVEKTVKKSKGRPDRYVYSITETGMKKLVNWLKESVDYNYGSERNEMLLKLFFGSKILPDFNIKHILRHKERCKQLIRVYTEIEQKLKEEKKDDPDFIYWMITLSHGKHRLQAAIAWCDEAISLIKEQVKST